MEGAREEAWLPALYIASGHDSEPTCSHQTFKNSS